MVLPIIAALSRDLFLTVPAELKDGAAALGATPWEIIRGVVLPTTVSGVSAAVVLGLGRALGEAIAVSLMIGDGAEIHASLFDARLDSLAARDRQRVHRRRSTRCTRPSLFYAGLILLVIGMLTSVAARTIAGRFDVQPESHLSATIGDSLRATSCRSTRRRRSPRRATSADACGQPLRPDHCDGSGSVRRRCARDRALRRGASAARRP